MNYDLFFEQLYLIWFLMGEKSLQKDNEENQLS
jgi:hypothetical protein